MDQELPFQTPNPVTSTTDVQPTPAVQPTQASPPPQPTSPKKSAWLIITLFIILFISLSGAGYFAYQNQQLKQQPPIVQPTPSLKLSPFPSLDLGDKETSCQSHRGTWLSEFNECEGATLGNYEEECKNLGGEFFSCESACRHDPDAQVCIQVCIQVCKYPFTP